jgi:hypothetical protein
MLPMMASGPTSHQRPAETLFPELVMFLAMDMALQRVDYQKPARVAAYKVCRSPPN